jgi:hypothetical protein
MMIAAVVALLSVAQAAAPSTLAGEWSVDLTTDPAKPYLKTMSLSLAADGAVTGRFYDSDIQGGRWKTDRGRTCASFRTTDGVGPYHSSVCLMGDQAVGQTWAEHRKFLFNWIAARP